jgi:hypothetical protein
MGLISFSDFMFIISIGMIACALIWLFGIHFIFILSFAWSIETIEFVFYPFLTMCVYFTPAWFNKDLWHIWGLLFVCGLHALTILTGYKTRSGNISLYYFVNMVIHGIVGIYLESTFICGMSILFLMSLIGFKFGFGRGYFEVGYSSSDTNIIPSATFAAGLVTLGGVIVRVMINSNDQLLVTNNLFRNALLFAPGALWIGPFVFYVSLLIISSYFYDTDKKYVTNNVIAFMLYVFSVFIGSTFNINQLSGFSGTFFVLFLLEKYIDLMPNRSEVWAWSILLSGIALYVLNMHFRQKFAEYGFEQYFHILPLTYNVPNITIPINTS